MSEPLYVAYLMFLLVSVLLCIYVAYRLFADPTTIKSHPAKFAIPLGVSFSLALGSGILSAIYSAIPRSDFSCRVGGYAVPASLTCEARGETNSVSWSLYRAIYREEGQGGRGLKSVTSSTGLRFSYEITEPGPYDIDILGNGSFWGFRLSTFASPQFNFGTPEDILGSETRTVDFRFDKEAFTRGSCEVSWVKATDGERIGYSYIRQIQTIDGSVKIDHEEDRVDQVTMTVCFTTIMWLQSWERAFVSGQLVLGVERP